MPLAHVKWFITQSSEVAPYSMHEPIVWIWLGVGIALVGLAFTLNLFVKGPKKSLLKKAEKQRAGWVYAFQVMLAASLLFGAWNEVILVPHYAAETLAWPIAEVLAVLLLLLNRGIPIASLLLVFVYLGAVLNFGPLEAMDYVNMLGIASFLILLKAPWPKLKPYRKYALPSLRVLTGLALVILAFTEKIAAPGKAMELLAHYDMNFMLALGFEHFNHRLFVLSAGFMEAVFGIIMMAGWITRINTAILAVFLIASNTYFFIQGHPAEGWTELLGHLPVIGTALLFIVFGNEMKPLSSRS